MNEIANPNLFHRFHTKSLNYSLSFVVLRFLSMIFALFPALHSWQITLDNGKCPAQGRPLLHPRIPASTTSLPF